MRITLRIDVKCPELRITRKVYQITSKHLRIDCIVSYFTEEEIHRVVLHAINRDWLCSTESNRSLSNWISVFIVSQDSTLFHSYQFHSLVFSDPLPKHLYPSQSIILSNHSLLFETV
ncbi:unnamed protein product [Albugo candida]|uniref:Uncharacterized protein n=1 Tax=Albugo candida TaxID=65357 RepID=A0A024G7U2_9STRA|nr:unnamed protein product [Albugo candida]|eukprot:CCI42635.1 unnamed protein product [Albugo candida]